MLQKTKHLFDRITGGSFTINGPGMSGANFSIQHDYNGVDMEAIAKLVAWHALLNNPFHGPLSFDEIARKAKEATDALFNNP